MMGNRPPTRIPRNSRQIKSESFQYTPDPLITQLRSATEVEEPALSTRVNAVGKWLGSIHAF